MAKTVISLDEQQVMRLEQAIIDHDEKIAWDLLREIRVKVRTTLDTRCGLDELRNMTEE